MKNKIWIVIAAAFVVIMAAAAILYPKLSEKYKAESTTAESKLTEVVQTEDFTIYDSEMNKVQLSDYFGKPIVVNFWATWCGPCKSELPAFNSAYEKYKEDVVFLMVNLPDGYRDTTDSVQQFAEENGYGFPVYFDLENDASITYGVNSIPETLFINADGTLYETRIGAMDDTFLENYIQQLIGE